MQLAALLCSLQPLLESILAQSAQNASSGGPPFPLAFPHFIPLCSISTAPGRGIFGAAHVSRGASPCPLRAPATPIHPPPPPSHFKHELCGQAKVYMADGSADHQREARLRFTISVRK